MDELREAGLFTYLVETDTYRTAQDVQDILVKTHPTDTEKIATIKDLVGRSLDPGAAARPRLRRRRTMPA